MHLVHSKPYVPPLAASAKQVLVDAHLLQKGHPQFCGVIVLAHTFWPLDARHQI